jgi:hypothetical protein
MFGDSILHKMHTFYKLIDFISKMLLAIFFLLKKITHYNFYITLFYKLLKFNIKIIHFEYFNIHFYNSSLLTGILLFIMKSNL